MWVCECVCVCVSRCGVRSSNIIIAVVVDVDVVAVVAVAVADVAASLLSTSTPVFSRCFVRSRINTPTGGSKRTTAADGRWERVASAIAGNLYTPHVTLQYWCVWMYLPVVESFEINLRLLPWYTRYTGARCACAGRAHVYLSNILDG